MANRREQRKIDLLFKNIRLENKHEQNEKNEKQRICQRNRLSSQLKEVLSVLLNEQFQIKTSTEKMMKDTTANFYDFLTNLMADSLSNVSVIQSSFQIPESFSQHLSNVKPKLEQLSEQISLIKKLIHDVSPSVSTALSEEEQRIIFILSVKSFLNSREVANVQRMINVCSTMRDCLVLLSNYPGEIDDEMSEDSDDEMFEYSIDPVRPLSNTNNLNEVSQELAGLKQKIDEITASFSEKYSIESLFSESDDFSAFVDFMQLLEPEIGSMTTKFLKIKNDLVEFVEYYFNIYYGFVERHKNTGADKYVRAQGCQFNMERRKYYLKNVYKEPAENTRKSLKTMLDGLKLIFE